jgi:hypothetical protein
VQESETERQERNAIEGIFQACLAHGKMVYEEAEKVPISDKEDYRLILRYFFGRALRDYHAIYYLWNKGFGAECLTVGRPLIELMLQSWYLLQDPSPRALMFFQHAKVMRYQIAERARKFLEEGKTVAPPDWFDPSTPRIVAMRAEYEAHKNKFRMRKSHKLWTNWWCGTLATIAEQALVADQKYGQYLFDQHRFEYQIGSAYVHSSEVAMGSYIYKDEKGYHVRPPEELSEPRVPLHMSQRFVLLCIFVDRAYDLGLGEQLTKDWDDIQDTFRGTS